MLKLLPNLREFLLSMRREIQDIFIATTGTIPRRLDEIKQYMAAVEWLAAAEKARQEARLRTLWVSINPKTGDLEHKFTTPDKVEKFLGTRYVEATKALKDARLGEPIYIDGAFFVNIVGLDEPANVKRYDRT
jgi:hypothetical protein